MRSNRKAQLAKGRLRYGESCRYYLLDIAAGGLKPQGPSEVKSIRPVLQGPDPITGP